MQIVLQGCANFQNRNCTRNDVCLCRIIYQILGETFYCVHRLSNAFDLHLVQFIVQFCVYVRMYFMFEFPCIITLYYIKNQLDATLPVLFISNCKITLHVSDAFCIHHQEY